MIAVPLQSMTSARNPTGHVPRRLNIVKGGTLRGATSLPAVVLKVIAILAAVDPSSLMDAGEIEHCVSDGAPLQAKVTIPLSPPSGVTVKL